MHWEHLGARFRQSRRWAPTKRNSGAAVIRDPVRAGISCTTATEPQNRPVMSCSLAADVPPVPFSLSNRCVAAWHRGYRPMAFRDPKTAAPAHWAWAGDDKVQNCVEGCALANPKHIRYRCPRTAAESTRPRMRLCRLTRRTTTLLLVHKCCGGAGRSLVARPSMGSDRSNPYPTLAGADSQWLPRAQQRLLRRLGTGLEASHPRCAPGRSAGCCRSHRIRDGWPACRRTTLH